MSRARQQQRVRKRPHVRPPLQRIVPPSLTSIVSVWPLTRARQHEQVGGRDVESRTRTAGAFRARLMSAAGRIRRYHRAPRRFGRWPCDARGGDPPYPSPPAPAGDPLYARPNLLLSSHRPRIAAGRHRALPYFELGAQRLSCRRFWVGRSNKKAIRTFSPFLVATHFATATRAPPPLFWKDWLRYRARRLVRSLRDVFAPLRMIVTPSSAGSWSSARSRQDYSDSRSRDTLRKVFASPDSAAIFLIINGLLLFGAEQLAPPRARRAGDRTRRGQRGSPSASPGGRRSASAPRRRSR